MPYYSELGLTSMPSSSAYSSLFLSGPYSNHSSIIASNYSPPKSIPRQYRGVYKPHLSTITELNAPLRRISSPKLLYKGTPTTIRPIKKINTADIDVSVNRYKRYDKYDRSKPEVLEKKTPEKSPSPIRSPRQSVEEKDQVAKPNTNIRRDRPTIRLQTVHRDTVQKEIGEIKSWRDNFKPEELGIEARRIKKSPGEILKEKFLIRSRSKENILKAESKKPSRKNSIRKSPSFHEICESISSDNIDVDLNPGQPEEIQRRQSRQISGENLLKHIRRTSTDLSEDELNLLDAILSEQNAMPAAEKESFESRGSVRKKRGKELEDEDERKEFLNRVNKSHSKERIPDVEVKSPLQRRPVKKRSRPPSVEKDETGNKLTEDIYKNVIRDISQVEIEQTAYKPKPMITGSGEIEQTKTALKAVIDDVDVQETPKPKKEKKFRFNVIVEVQDEDDNERRSSTPKETKVKPPGEKMSLTEEHLRTVQHPSPEERVILSILKKRSPVHKGEVIEEKVKKVTKVEVASYGKEQDNRNKSAPTSPVVLDSGLIHQLTSKKENASDSSLFDKPLSRPGTPTDKLKQLNNSSAPSSPLAAQRKFFSRENSKNDDSRPTSPHFWNKLKNSENSSTSSSPFGSWGNISNEPKQESRPCSPINKKKLDNISLPSSPLASKQNILSRDNSKSDVTPPSLPGTPKNKTAPSSPFASKFNLFNKDSSEKKNTPPSSPLSPLKRSNHDKPEDDASEWWAATRDASDMTKQNLVADVSSADAASAVASPINKGTEQSKKEERNEVKEETIDKDENDNTIEEDNEVPKKLISKRSLIQKANKDDPDLVVFIAPEPEPEPEPEPQPEENKDVFVPLQSNRISQFMHPFKKPEQFDVCPIEIFARPKVIRGRHYPRPRGHPAPPPPEDSSEDEEEEEESDEDTTSEEESSEEECEEGTATKIGASTSSNDSGFGSGAPGKNKDCDVNIHKKCEKLTANLCGVNQKLVVEAIESVRKGSLQSRDSPTSNHANNPAFALDSDDVPEEYSHSSTFSGFQKSGRITPPATTIPRFRKYCIDDFNFLKVLGKGSFGKVLLAELKGTEYYYAIKCLKKDVVLEDDDVECTLIERKVLALGTKHPYLCHLLCTFQTESHLFFVMEYLNGGDLMFHIQASGRFPEHQARFYGAEIVSGLKFLHNKGIVYRDLKLDNVLLDFDGHVRIADFGMCKLQIFLDRMAETFCGTPDYMAPEIIKGQHYNQCVDWWSFGVLLYEMLLGQSPFSGCDEDELFWSICNEKPVLPRFLSTEATNILTLFLEKDASKRLGNRFCPHGDIQDQPFFKAIDWQALEARQLEPPFKPDLQHPLDTQYFDKHFTVEKAKLTPIESTILQSMDQTQFQGFSYTNPNATDK